MPPSAKLAAEMRATADALRRVRQQVARLVYETDALLGQAEPNVRRDGRGPRRGLALDALARIWTARNEPFPSEQGGRLDAVSRGCVAEVLTTVAARCRLRLPLLCLGDGRDGGPKPG